MRSSQQEAEALSHDPPPIGVSPATKAFIFLPEDSGTEKITKALA